MQACASVVNFTHWRVPGLVEMIVSEKFNAEFVDITPEIAKAYVSTFTMATARAREKIVNKYAEVMRSGKWQVSLSPIYISPEGEVIDGAHRLYAILASGVTIRMLVIKDFIFEDRVRASDFHGLAYRESV